MFRYSIVFVLSLFLFVSVGKMQAQTVKVSPTDLREDNIWTGESSEDWNDPLNWNTSVVPVQTTNVTIPENPSGGNFPIIFASSSAECMGLTIDSGSSLQIRGFLTVNGEIINTDETALTLLSDETGTGSMIFNSGSNVVATVERYLSDGVNHFIGTPVAEATVEDLFFDNNPEVYLYYYNEATGSWSTLSELNEPLFPGLGYSVFVTSPGGKQDVTASFTGVLRADDLLLSDDLLTYTDSSPYPGYNLVCNPFSSAISWDLGNWQAENVTGCIWLWNGSYNYLFRNAHMMGNLSGGIVPMAQAFFVKTTGTAPSLTLSADDRVHSEQNFYKSAGRDDEPYFVVKVEGQDRTDEVWVAFCADCTEDYDTGWDTEKLTGSDDAPQLYLMVNDSKQSIDALPVLNDNETKIIQLDFEAGATGQYALSLSEVETGNGEELQIVLKDLLEGTEQIFVADEPYLFEASTGDDPGRFQLEVTTIPNGMNEPEAAGKYLIYTTSDNIVIKQLSPVGKGNLTIQITDMTGRNLMHTKAAEKEEIVIPVGVHNTYVIVRVVTEKTVITKKLFIH